MSEQYKFFLSSWSESGSRSVAGRRLPLLADVNSSREWLGMGAWGPIPM